MTDEKHEPRDDHEPRDRSRDDDVDSPPSAAAPEDNADEDASEGASEGAAAAPLVEEIGLEPLEGDALPSASRSSSEFNCPSCGAPMPGADTLVCLRCGYDLKTLKPIETETAVEEIEVLEPVLLTPPGRGGWKVPLIVAAAVGLLLIICMLAGVHGLHPRVVFKATRADAPVGTVEWGARMLGVVRLFVHTGLWTAGGAAGLTVVSWLTAGRIGDLPVAMARLLAIATTMKLVTLLELGGGPLEWTVETAGQAGLAFAGLLALFKIKPRDAGWLMATAAGVFLVVYGGARLLVSVS